MKLPFFVEKGNLNTYVINCETYAPFCHENCLFLHVHNFIKALLIEKCPLCLTCNMPVLERVFKRDKRPSAFRGNMFLPSLLSLCVCVCVCLCVNKAAGHSF